MEELCQRLVDAGVWLKGSDRAPGTPGGPQSPPLPCSPRLHTKPRVVPPTCVAYTDFPCAETSWRAAATPQTVLLLSLGSSCFLQTSRPGKGRDHTSRSSVPQSLVWEVYAVGAHFVGCQLPPRRDLPPPARGSPACGRSSPFSCFCHSSFCVYYNHLSMDFISPPPWGQAFGTAL